MKWSQHLLSFPPERRRAYEGICRWFHLPSHRQRVSIARELAERHRGELPSLSQESGFLVWPEGKELASVQEALDDAKERIQRANLSDLTHPMKKREKCFKEIPVSHDKLIAKPYLALATDPRLLTIISEYFGFLPVLNMMQVLYSPNNESVVGSSPQEFHLDAKGYRMVRAYVFIHSVSSDSGPVTALPIQESRKVYGVYRGGGLSDEKVSRLADASKRTELVGAEGTVAFIDTSRCFHYGSRPGKSPRFVIHLQYQSPYTLDRPLFREGPAHTWDHLIDRTAPPLQRLLFHIR